MKHPSLDLTPPEIVTALDRYIVGQNNAKRAVAIALRNRWRRQNVSNDLRDEITPKNIIMIGPTGVGKTEIARRLAKMSRAPFVKVEASKFTEVGYVGRDVESMIRDLVEVSIGLVKSEAESKVEPRVQTIVEDRVLELLKDRIAAPVGESLAEEPQSGSRFIVGTEGVTRSDDAPVSRQEALRQRLRSGAFDDELVELELQDTQNPMANMFSSQPGMEDVDLSGMLGNIFPNKRRKRKLKVREAMRQLTKEESSKFIDMEEITAEAVRRAQESGIIFIDEIDKVAGRGSGQGPDVSREGVQRDLLPIVEGSSVSTIHGIVSTEHILFVAAGAFHVSKPSDLIPELQGRFPIRVELESLTEQDFVRILTEPKNSLVTQYVALMATEGVTVDVTEEAVGEIAKVASQVNGTLENIGARRLHTVMEKLFEELSFSASEMAEDSVTIDAAYVHEKLNEILGDEDLSRYIL